MAGPEQDHQGPAVAIYELMDLRGQPATRPPNPMITRLGARILAIRQFPLCCGRYSWRADELG